MTTTPQEKFEREFERIIDKHGLEAVYDRHYANTGTLRAMSSKGFETLATVGFSYMDGMCSIHIDKDTPTEINYYALKYGDVARIYEMFAAFEKALR